MSNGTMRSEFPENDQRAAVCSRQFEKGKVAKQFPSELSAGDGERAIVAMISTTAVDRDGDVMLPSGIDLRNFNKLPTVLMMHDNQKLPIGRVPSGGIRQMPSGVQAKAIMLERPKTLPTNVEWPPDTVLDLFRQNAPLGFSVGFRIKNARVATKKDKGKFGGEVQRVITDWELLEFSVVPIPSNADALAVAVSKCHCPVGAFTRGALGLERKAKITVKPPIAKRLRMDFGVPGARLRI